MQTHNKKQEISVYCYRGTSAAETAPRINDVYSAGVANETTVRFWFQRIRSGDLQNQPRGQPETRLENEELKAIETQPNTKRKFTQKKLLVSVWWTSAGVVHYSFLKSGQTITADVYCQQLQTMKEELARPLLLHDKAKPHTLQLECLRHPPYSLDLAPIDIFFRNLNNFLQGKKFNSDAAVQTAFKEFIDSLPHKHTV
ncbi:hypothetical protein ABMA27_000440 [Loxostege sticticalis]|uniref:Mos1 transposase HTH domain-containing protein n=1 Tax=Loxostege sticticalis TaxID=481309 RepID=A0ABR3INF3_LOXSC